MYLRNSEIKFLSIQDKEYPKGLKRIDDAPETLFYRGDFLKNEQCLAIVGARRCSDYGKEIAFAFAKDLAQAGLTIVSGMARGIDTFAHQGALEAKGRTIAVLGTGLDEKSIYPQENLKLAGKILEQNGCLISEYPAGTRGAQFTFPARNRIISGISLGTLVIEAKIKSGALITAGWAKKQGSQVFALPGSIHSKNSKGPHLLIKTGKAILVESANDILKTLAISPPPLTKIGGDPISPNLEAYGGRTPVSLEQGMILKILEQGSLHIDQIIEKTKLPIHKVSSSLSLMEIENKVKNLGANVYALMR